MAENMQHYDNLKSVPPDALKKIEFGKLKGKSDISPQWRYEAMTREFGACGTGWKFEVVDTFTKDLADGQILLFVKVNLYTKISETWSEPIPGFGGDFLVIKDKNGIHGNDEAYKMATTDALGTAMKLLGVAADVYRGLADSKYGREKEQPQQQAQKPVSKPVQQQGQKPQQGKADNAPTDEKKQLLIKLSHHAKEVGLSPEDVKQLMQHKYKVVASGDLTIDQVKDLIKNASKYWSEFIKMQEAS